MTLKFRQALDAFQSFSTLQPSSTTKMAPTTTIETVTITRPLKVIAFICGIVVIVLMIMALSRFHCNYNRQLVLDRLPKFNWRGPPEFK